MRASINRRAFLRTAASASAVAAGAGTVTIVNAAQNPDAELIALGHDLDESLEKWWGLSAEFDAIHAMVGLKFPGNRFGRTGRELDAWNAEADRLGLDVIADANDAALGAVTAISDRIAALPAATIAGIAVKAKRLGFEAGLYGKHLDAQSTFEQRVAHDFIAEVERMAQAGRT